jgi:hypothetical protein
MAILEIPDGSQVDGPICVPGPQGSDVTSSQQFLGSWVKRLSRHLPLHSRARFGKGANLPLLLEHRKQHGGSYTMDVEISPFHSLGLAGG